MACGIKPSGRPDLALLVCDAPEPASAARFTASGAPAAPVTVTKERCRLSSLRAVLANAGCANAATGARGLDDAAKTQGGAAVAVGIAPTLQGRGVGGRLLSEAVRRSRDFGLKTLLGFIFAHNEPSLKLFTQLGFARWGLLPGVARLDGIERDLTIMGRQI